MSTSFPIDPQVIETLRSLDPEAGDHFLRDIVALYITDTDPKLIRLGKAIDEGRLADAAQLAHSLKGSAANLGAVVVRSIASQIEEQALSGQHKELPLLFKHLDEAFQEARSALEQII